MHSFKTIAEGYNYLLYKLDTRQTGTFSINLYSEEGQSIRKQRALNLYYTFCESSTTENCYLTEDQLAVKKRSGMTTVKTYTDLTRSLQFDIGDLYGKCPFIKNCVIMLLVKNPYTENLKTYLELRHLTYTYEKISMNTAYRNVKDKGTYSYYRLQIPSLQYMKYLRVALRSYQGDADLYLSQTQEFPSRSSYGWASQELGGFTDLISLTKTDATLSAA